METEITRAKVTQQSSAHGLEPDLVLCDPGTAKYIGDENYESRALKFIFVNHFKWSRSIPSSSYRDRIRMFSDKQNLPAPLLRCEVDLYINDLNIARKCLEKGGALRYDYQRTLMDQYEVIEGKDDHTESVLIEKRSSPEEEPRRVLGAEDAYDVLYAAHRDGPNHHAPFTDMQPALATQYSIPTMFIVYFLKLCKVCKNTDDTDTDTATQSPHPDCRFNDTVQVGLHTIHHSWCTVYFVLIYRDNATDYVLLRPLIHASELHLSTELFKIFADFGIPVTIQTCSEQFDLIDRALQLLHKRWPVMTMSIDVVEDNLSEEVEMLSEWIEQKGCNDWSIECHILQKILNNQIHKNCSPYEMVFGSQSKTTETERSTDEQDMQGFESLIPAQTIRKINSNKSDWGAQDFESCHVCNGRIIKPYVCDHCHKTVHLFCCQRTITNAEDCRVTVDIMCRPCRRLKLKISK